MIHVCTLLKKMYKSWTNGSFESVCDLHGKVIYCISPRKLFHANTFSKKNRSGDSSCS